MQIKNLDGEVLLENVQSFEGRIYLDHQNLERADLRGMVLSEACLYGANLSGADLSDADLRDASLTWANLSGANLRTAKIFGAEFHNARLDGAKLPDFQIPQEGSLIGWKKLCCGFICKLEIPAEARRTAALGGNKCRAEFAKVLSITSSYGEFAEPEVGRSLFDISFKYVVGEIVRPHKFSDDIRSECQPGIHFFMTREEAEEY